MIILAIDPGPVHCGFAIVRSFATKTPLYLTGGEAESTFERFSRLVESARKHVELDTDDKVVVGIERPVGMVYDPVRGAQLLGTANVAGGAAWAAQAFGLEIVEIPAQSVRRTIIGTKVPKVKGAADRMVKEALPNFVRGIPARTNEHVRDALAVAVCADFLARNLRMKAS